MGKNLYKRLQSHRLNPLNNARLHNWSTCHLYLAKSSQAYALKLHDIYDIYLVHRSLVCLVYEMSSFNLICLFVIANNIQLKSALVKIGAQ